MCVCQCVYLSVVVAHVVVIFICCEKLLNDFVVVVVLIVNLFLSEHQFYGRSHMMTNIFLHTNNSNRVCGNGNGSIGWGKTGKKFNF